jgi:hypothetical protein
MLVQVRDQSVEIVPYLVHEFLPESTLSATIESQTSARGQRVTANRSSDKAGPSVSVSAD